MMEMEMGTMFGVRGEWVQGTPIRAEDWWKRTYFERLPDDFNPEDPRGVEYSDCDGDWVEQADVPAFEEMVESHRRYAAWVAEHGEDPLNEYYVRDPIVHREVWECQAAVTDGSVVAFRVRLAASNTEHAGETAQHVVEADWVSITGHRHQWYFDMEGMTLDEADAHVVAGTYDVDTSGNGTVVLTSAPHPDAFKRIEVTREMLQAAAKRHLTDKTVECV